MELFDKLSVRDVHIQNLLVLGYVADITGTDNISEAQFCIDKKNYRIIVLNEYDKNLNNYSDDYEISYNIDDIIGLKYERCYTQKFINQTVVREYFKLMVSGNHCIDFYIEKSFSNTDAGIDEILSDNDKRLRLNLIYPFIHLIEDKATIYWVNEFCEHNDLLPLFDESGEVSVKHIKENAKQVNI